MDFMSFLPPPPPPPPPPRVNWEQAEHYWFAQGMSDWACVRGGVLRFRHRLHLRTFQAEILPVGPAHSLPHRSGRCAPRGRWAIETRLLFPTLADLHTYLPVKVWFPKTARMSMGSGGEPSSFSPAGQVTSVILPAPKGD